MKKTVSELSPEEFQKTFPIILQPYSLEYKEWYKQEEKKILDVINRDDVIRINHIGSSAIPNIVSKPVIDILLEIDGSCNVTKLLESLKTIGFGEEVSSKTENPFRILLAKGMSCDGFADKVFLLHVRYYGDWNELYFRDYLLEHPEVAEEYGQLKERILKDIQDGKLERMPNGQPNGYSQAKYEFVEKISIQAKQELKGRYKL